MSDEEWAKMPQETVENYAARLPRDAPNVGRARAELLKRDRYHAEQQEKSRREFENTLADKQLKAAADVAWATKWAMIAAIASAFGALIQALVAIHHW